MRNWDRLKVFDAVARHGSVRAASEELGISGSAVSQQLRRLERELDQALVERAGRGLRLTSAGVVLARHSREVTERIDGAAAELSRLSDEIAGPLRIGGLLSSVRALLGPALAELVGIHDRVRPTVVDGEAVDFLEQLSHRTLDVAMIESWPSNAFGGLSSVTAEVLLDEPVDMAVPAWLDPQPRRLDDVVALPWVVCPVGSGAYQTVVDRLRQAGREPDIRHQISSYASQLDLVASGLAVALVPRLAAEGIGDRDIRLVAVEPPLQRRLLVVTRSGEERPIVGAFVEVLRRHAESLR